MLGAVEDEDFARDGLGGDQVRVLRHVARAVDLARVVDLLHDVDARLARGQRVPAELAPLVVVRAAVEDVRARPGARGDLHRRDLQVVRRLSRGVRAEKQAVRRVGFVWRAGSVSGRLVEVRTWVRWELYKREGGRTILCRGTIDKLGSASRGHALSSDRTSMGRSSSCRNVYETT